MEVKRFGLMLLVLLPAACTPAWRGQSVAQPAESQSAVVSDFLAIVPQIVQATAPSRRSGVPLLLDLQSFADAGSAASGHLVRTELVAGAIGREFRDSSAEDAIINPSESRYEIRDRGRHIRLERFSKVGDGYEATITQLYTEERGQSAAIGIRQVALVFHSVSGEWHLQSQRLLGTS